MNIYPNQLKQQLEKSLAPIYIVSGDEPLQCLECADAVRAEAKKQGYLERQIVDIDKKFSWDSLAFEFRQKSLFSQQVLIELRLVDAKFSDDAKKALQAMATQPPKDKLILIICPKIDKRTLETKWFNPVSQVAVVVQAWPVDKAYLPQWIKQRAQMIGLKLEATAIDILVNHSEGNLLALKQEMEKLKLLFPNETVSADQVATAIANNARYDIFGLADAMLQGDMARIIKIITALQQEGIEPILVLWAIVRDIRMLASIAWQCEQQNKNPANLFMQHGVWPKRQPLVRKALQRGKYKDWYRLLEQAQMIDTQMKSEKYFNPWLELQRLIMDVV